ncbi:hypothetical protein SMICM17S_12296 [Streptomyces microflavus]
MNRHFPWAARESVLHERKSEVAVQGARSGSLKGPNG